MTTMFLMGVMLVPCVLGITSTDDLFVKYSTSDGQEMCASDDPSVSVDLQLQQDGLGCIPESARCGWECRMTDNCTGFNIRTDAPQCHLFRFPPTMFAQLTGCRHFRLNSSINPSSNPQMSNIDDVVDGTILPPTTTNSQLKARQQNSTIQQVTTVQHSTTEPQVTTTVQPMQQSTPRSTSLLQQTTASTKVTTTNPISTPYLITTLSSVSPGFNRTTAVLTPGSYIVQSRNDSTTVFNTTWNVMKYQQSAKSFYWIGLETLHRITSMFSCTLYINMTSAVPNVATYSACYDSFSIGNESTNYALNLTFHSTTGNITNALDGQNGKPFSTFDMDNDDDDTVNCAALFASGWWYGNSSSKVFPGKRCGNTNLNSAVSGYKWSKPSPIQLDSDIMYMTCK